MLTENATSSPDAVRAAEAFRHAMRRHATTVCVVATVLDGVRYGNTATSVMSMSMRPAAIAVAIDRNATMHDRLVESGRFSINMLRQGQESISSRFASKPSGEERFLVGDWRHSDTGIPYIFDAQASVFCSLKNTVPFGTHTLFIGEVEDVHYCDDIAPLLYVNGGHISLPQHG
jgi:flavin reductase (DIM6/NTAB) family NADH-FMN oxidoreductase RutF